MQGSERHAGVYHLIFLWAEVDLFGYWKWFLEPPNDETITP
jgi:hypothetical protein